MRNTKTPRKKTIITAICLAIALLVGGYFIYSYATKSTWPFMTNSVAPNNTEADPINYDPPTEQEVEASQDAKKSNHDDATKTPASNGSSAKNTVSVGIAYAGYEPSEGVIDIRAFVPNTIEGDGTCTATLSKGSQTVTASSRAFVDSTSSQCRPILISKDRFSEKGEWNLTVHYSSSKSSGTSTTMKVEVE